MQGMTALAPVEAYTDPRRVPVDVEIVVPVYNEAAQLAAAWLSGPPPKVSLLVPETGLLAAG